MTGHYQLAEIVEMENPLLLDAGVSSSNGFYWWLGGIKIPEQLERDKMKEEIHRLDYFVSLLKNPHARTIEKVCEELSKIARHVANVRKFIFGGYDSEEYPDEEILLEELEASALSLWQTSKKATTCKRGDRLLSSNIENFSAMLKLLAPVLEIKRDYHKKYGNHKANGTSDSDTDEYISATLYELFLSGKTPAIATKDTDILRFLTQTPAVLCSNEFSPAKQDLKEAVCNMGFKVYFSNPSSEEFKAIQVKPNSYECQAIRDSRISQEDKRKIREFWAQIRSR